MGQFAEVTYDGGTANAGPAIRINAAAGRFRFYGLVALYIPAQTGIALVLYNGENLAGIGTVIQTLVRPLLLGDVLRIEVSDTVLTSYRVRVNGTTVISATLSASQISPLNSCVGFVEVFNVPILVPLGGCVLQDTSCIVTTEAACIASNGSYLGDQTSCPPPPTGACILPNLSCIVTTEDDCIAASGTYQGNFTNCGSEAEQEEGILIVKSVDESKINDVTLAFDSELKVGVGANETWAMEVRIRYLSGTGVPALRYGFFGPLGSSGWWLENFTVFFHHNLGESDTIFTDIVETDLILRAVCINGVTPGNFGFQWAPNILTGDFVKVLAQSWLIATKKA